MTLTTDHDNAYAELLGSDDSQWAFGHDFEDPLAGVDTSVPAGLDAGELAQECLRLGDDALVLSHRLSEWCSNAPDLELDIALANIALDLLGQARLLLARAAAADPAVVPVLPEGSPVPAEDALAYFRDAAAYRCTRLVELDNGDFAQTVARLLLVSTARLAEFERLERPPRDPVLRGDRRQGDQGAHLPPRLRCPLVRHAGAGHRRVAAAAGARAHRGVALPRGGRAGVRRRCSRWPG